MSESFGTSRAGSRRGVEVLWGEVFYGYGGVCPLGFAIFGTQL